MTGEPKKQKNSRKFTIYNYSVVQFNEDEETPTEKLFECIPDLWFANNSKTVCFWPPKRGKSFSLCVINCEKPDDSWGVCECSVVSGGYSTYSSGFKIVREKCSQKYNTSSADEHIQAANFLRKHPVLAEAGESFEHLFTKPSSTSGELSKRPRLGLRASISESRSQRSQSPSSLTSSTDRNSISRKRKRNEGDESRIKRTGIISDVNEIEKNISPNSDGSKSLLSNFNDERSVHSYRSVSRRSNSSSVRLLSSCSQNNHSSSAKHSRTNQVIKSRSSHSGSGNRSRSGHSRTSHSRSSHSRTSHSRSSHSRTSHSRTSHSRTSHSRTSHSRLSHSRTIQSHSRRTAHYDASNIIHERANNVKQKRHPLLDKRRINTKKLGSSKRTKRNEISTNRKNKTLKSCRISTSSEFRSQNPQLSCQRSRFSSERSQSSLRHSQSSQSRSRSRTSNLSANNSMAKITELTKVVRKNNDRLADNERRFNRMEVTINKILIMLCDMNRNSDGNSIRDYDVENHQRFDVPCLPIINNRELTIISRKLKDKEFREFWLSYEKIFCCPTKRSTDTVVMTKYLKRFISLKLRCRLTFKERGGESGLTLFGDYHRLYMFLIDVIRAGYRSCKKSITTDDAHTALRIVWGRSKQLEKEEAKKR